MNAPVRKVPITIGVKFKRVFSPVLNVPKHALTAKRSSRTIQARASEVSARSFSALEKAVIV
jgi:hypothetical protein